jgi:hypothetical protein
VRQGSRLTYNKFRKREQRDFTRVSAFSQRLLDPPRRTRERLCAGRFTLLTTRDAVLPRLVTCMMTVRTSLPLGVRAGRLRRHWPKTRIVWRGDSHYGRVEAMEWAEDHDAD